MQRADEHRVEEIRRGMVALLPRLTRFALGLTRSRADAHDLVQAACERALTRTEQWTLGTRLDSWMFRIMQSIWFNELRSRKVQRHHAEREQIDPAFASGEQIVEDHVLLRGVEEAIFALPEHQRAVLMLVCVEGLTYAEAAETLSIPIGTVMSRLARARLSLMQRFEGNAAVGRDNIARFLGTWKR
jgi:RNA polymerase sigma-70 factor (ECF subfamily)